MSRATRRVPPQDRRTSCRPNIIPSLRDGALVGRFPGNKLPGYDHSVPSGQVPTSPFGPTNRHYCPHFSTPHHYPTLSFEDEDDDEDDLILGVAMDADSEFLCERSFQRMGAYPYRFHKALDLDRSVK